MAITDEKSAKAWLEVEGRTHEERIALAARAAMRALPGLGSAHDAALGDLALPVIRAMLTSGVAANLPTPEVKDAAHAAAAPFSARSARSVARSAAYAAFSAAHAAAAPFSARSARSTYSADSATYSAYAAFSAAHAATPALSAAFSATDADARKIDDSALKDVFATPLWPDGGVPDFFAAGFANLQAFWNGTPEVWGFWQRWYEGMLKGEPLPWELQEKVALIPDDIWSQGPNVVAGEIRKLELESKTSAYPRLVRDTEAGVFRVEEDPLPPAEVADFVCRRISLALDAALKSSGPNAFDERAYEATIIRDTLASEPRSVSILAVGFFDACLALNKNIGIRYPEEVALTNLRNALWSATEELCELDEVARARCARLAGFNPKKSVDDLDKADLQAIPEYVAPEVDEKAREIIESDIERTLSKEKPVTRSVRIRLTNWLTTISIWMDRAMKGDKRAQWLASIVERLREWLENSPPE